MDVIGCIILQTFILQFLCNLSAMTGAATATTTALGGVSHGLAHQSEGAFLSDEAEGTKVLDGFLASGVLLTRNDTSFVLHEV